MKYQHYSPQVPVILLVAAAPPKGSNRENFEEIIQSLLPSVKLAKNKLRIGLLLAEDSKIANPSRNPLVDWEFYSLGSLGDKSIMGSRLFDGLLDLEGRGVDFILTESIDETQEGLAFMNRLTKAASEVRWLQ
jgi:L-threonylcarbamoyladenylate synthase